MTIGHWQPKIGDPSFMGWFTVYSYYLCAGLSLSYVLKARPRMDGTDRRFGISMTVLVLVLGIIKNFNLPATVTEIGRIVADHLGGYELRRWPQAFMMLLVAICLLFHLRRAASQQGRRAPETICLVNLCSLVILRAISLHQTGALLSAKVFGIPINWIAELTGIYALIIILFVRIFAQTSKGK